MSPSSAAVSKRSVALAVTAVVALTISAASQVRAEEPPPALAPEASAPETAPVTPPENSTPPEVSAAPPEPPAPIVPEVEALPEAETSPQITETQAPPAEVAQVRRIEKGPAYQRIKPAWGVTLAGSIKALGPTTVFPGQASNQTIQALTLQAEYQPRFFQSLGVLSLGPSASFYPTTPTGTLTSSAFSIFSFGGQARYQARFFKNQPIVPMAGFSAEYVRYRVYNGTSGGLWATGPVFGGLLLLNWFDESSASDMYVNYSITRSYLVAEIRALSGNDSNLTLSGNSFFFGVRFEL